MEYVTCPSCGAEVERRRLCGECGTPLSDEPNSPAVAIEDVPHHRSWLRPVLGLGIVVMVVGAAGIVAFLVRHNSAKHYDLTGSIALLGQSGYRTISEGG